jgi:hypothetical protein
VPSHVVKTPALESLPCSGPWEEGEELCYTKTRTGRWTLGSRRLTITAGLGRGLPVGQASWSNLGTEEVRMTPDTIGTEQDSC